MAVLPIQLRPASEAQGSASAPGNEQSRRRLKGVAAIVLLGGTLRPSQMQSAIQRSLLNLPVTDQLDLLGHWCQQSERFAQEAGFAHCRLRVQLAPGSAVPTITQPTRRVHVEVEVDQSKFRGTGGVLRDIAADFKPDDYLLVAHAGQILLEPLYHLAMELARFDTLASLISHDDGTPSGLMLVQCGVLATFPTKGFQDLKEQILPRIAREHGVQVIHRRAPTGIPVRTPREYITALRTLGRMIAGTDDASDPFAEDWYSTFALVEDGAEVAAKARIRDSVVLSGARVESGAVVVRSVVCPGAVVKRGITVVDKQVVDQSQRNRG